jgi:hypothetical protein
VLHDNLIQSAAVIIPLATLLKFHILLKQQKYHLLFSAGRKAWPQETITRTDPSHR